MNKEMFSGGLLWTGIFLVIAIIAGIFGFGLISGFSFAIAKWLAIIFGILFVISVMVRVFILLVVAHVIKNA